MNPSVTRSLGGGAILPAPSLVAPPSGGVTEFQQNLAHGLGGMVAAGASTIVAQPFEVLKTRVQKSNGRPVEVLRGLYSDGLIRSLRRGLELQLPHDIFM